MLKLQIILLALIISPVLSQGQQGNMWTFGGHGGLDFNNNPPTLFLSSCRAYANTGTICDEMGHLLFYTDGNKVYNKNHELIANGDSIMGISGHNQGCIILPCRFNSNLFFLYTINYEPFISGVGLYCNIIDMSKNGGKGQVLNPKNNKISNEYFIYLSAVKHANGKDYWLISSKLDKTFYAFQFSGNGIVSTVISYNVLPDTITFRPIWNYAKLLPSNKRDLLVEPIYSAQPIEFTSLILYNFNSRTGDVTLNKIMDYIKLNPNKEKRISKSFIDAAFSPNDSFLYVSYRTISNNKPSITQYSIFDSNIFNYTYPEPDDGNLLGNWASGAIKLAPDGKIYFCNWNENYINVIDSPDSPSFKCHIRPFVYQIHKKQSAYSVGIWTSFPQTIQNNMWVSFKHFNNCKSISFLNTSDTSIYKYFTWFFTANDSISKTNVDYHFPHSGKYVVKLRARTEAGYTKYATDTVVFFHTPMVNFGYKEKTGCQWLGFQFIDSTITDTFDQKKGKKWFWDFGDSTYSTEQNPVHIYSKSGIYDVKLVFDNGFCIDSITKHQVVDILAAPKPGFLLSDTIGCTPFTLSITDKSLGSVAHYFYDFGDGNSDTLASPTHIYTTFGKFTIKQLLTGSTGCITKDSQDINLIEGFDNIFKPNIYTATVTSPKSISINWQPDPIADYYNVYRKIQGNSLTPYAKTTQSNFIDSNVNPSSSVYSYQVQAADRCNRPTAFSREAKNILLTGLTQANDYSIIEWTPYEAWQNGVMEYQIEAEETNGFFKYLTSIDSRSYQDDNFYYDQENIEKCYRIKAVENEGNAQISYSNILCLPYSPSIWIPNAFSPNGDGINDVFNIKGLGIYYIKMMIFNRWGELVFETQDKETGWDGKMNGEYAEEGVYIYKIVATININQTIYYNGSFSLLR